MTPDQEESSRYSGRPEGLSKSDPPPQDITVQFEDFGLIPRPRVQAKPRLVDPLLGSDLGGVKIIRLIGEGGMGRVYEARQDRPRRTVAVKVIRQGITSEKTLRRFEREAEFLGRLQHRGIARIFVVGSYSSDYGDVPFYVMEHIADAKPITNYVHDKKLPLVDRLRLFQQVCEAVSHGHDRGIVHRDLKPGNILIDGDGQARVIDFGVARSTDADLTLTSMQTETGQLVGTMQYMSPEQFGANPEDLDGRADVYSLGVVLYEILTGVTPYGVQKKGIHEVARVVCEQPHVPIRTRGKTIPRDVVTITECCLQKDRRNRYPSAGHLAADVRRFIDGKPLFAAESLPLGLRWIEACMPWGRSGRKQLFIAVGTVVALASILIAVAGVQRVMVLPWPRPVDGRSASERLPPVNVEPPPIPAEGKLSRDVVVAADQIEGVVLGDFHKGDRLTIQYLSGEWTTCRERDKPCSPDTVAGGLRVLAEPGVDGFGFNIEVPAGTARQPFDYTFERDVSRVAIGMGDGHAGDNAGTVVYRVSTNARLGGEDPVKDTTEPELSGGTAAEASRLVNRQQNASMRNSIGMELIRIPAGTFQMGGSGSGIKVTLSRFFWIGMSEVTQGQWKSVMGTTPWSGDSVQNDSELPATNVDWEQVHAFCEKLTASERSKKVLLANEAYRLPTEAEWEYCCRAGMPTAYSFGDDASQLTEFAWFARNSQGVAHKVATKKPNAWGLYDMHGNVWEWCSDWFEETIVGGTDPSGPRQGGERVNRGGGWGGEAGYCQSDRRYHSNPSHKVSLLGFRVVRSQSVE